MNLRPVILLLSAAGLAAASFFAGYMRRGCSSGAPEQAWSTDHSKVGDRHRTEVGENERNLVGPAEAQRWVQQLTERQDLYGQRLKMEVAWQCSRLGIPAAEDLLKECEAHQSSMASGEIFHELALDALTRLSELDPERALEVLKKSSFLEGDSERIATVVAPLAAADMDRVVEFCQPLDSRAMVAERLLEVPGIGDQPELCLKMIPLCGYSAEVMGKLLAHVRNVDEPAAQKAFANLVAESGPEAVDRWKETADYFLGAPISYQEWVESFDGPGADRVQCFALAMLTHQGNIVEARGGGLCASSLFVNAFANLQEAERLSYAETIGQCLSYDWPSSAEQWLTKLEPGPMKEKALRGLYEGSLLPNSERADGTEGELAGYWLEKMMPSGDRDALLADYAGKLQASGDVSAAQWLEKISDPSTKEKAMRIFRLKGELAELKKKG